MPDRDIDLVANSAQDYYDLNQPQPAQIDVFAHLKSLPFSDCKMYLSHETSNGVQTLVLPLPVCPQKFLAFESEQFARSDRTVYRTGIQDEFHTETLRNFNVGLADVLVQMFPGSFSLTAGKLEGIFRYFSPALQVHYELFPESDARLKVHLFASCSDSQLSEHVVSEYLQTLMSNFNFILG